MNSQMHQPFNNEHCLTCVYWCGQRRIDTISKRVIIPSSNERGECGNIKTFYRQQMHWTAKCHGFERHPLTKK